MRIFIKSSSSGTEIGFPLLLETEREQRRERDRQTLGHTDSEPLPTAYN